MVNRNVPGDSSGIDDELSAIREDMANLREDVSELVKSVLELGRRRAAEAGERVQSQLEEGMDQLKDRFGGTCEQGERAVESVQQQVESHPFASLAAAFGLGFLLGRLGGGK